MGSNPEKAGHLEIEYLIGNQAIQGVKGITHALCFSQWLGPLTNKNAFISVGEKIDISCGNALEEVYYIGEGFDNFSESKERGNDWFWKDATL